VPPRHRPGLAAVIDRLGPELRIRHREIIDGPAVRDVVIATPATTPVARAGIAVMVARGAAVATATARATTATARATTASTASTATAATASTTTATVADGRSTVPARLALAREVLTRMPNPRFLDLVRVHDLFRDRAAGLTRDELTAPIAPAPEVRDTDRFEDAKTPGRYYYLPRYAIATSGDQLAVHLGTRGAQWVLNIKLVPSPAPEVVAAGGGSPIPHTLQVTLGYQSQEMAADKGLVRGLTITFTEIVQSADGAETIATAILPTLVERDAAYSALSQPDRGTTVTVTRTARIAVRKPPANPTQPVGGGATSVGGGGGTVAASHLGLATLARPHLVPIGRLPPGLDLELPRRPIVPRDPPDPMPTDPPPAQPPPERYHEGDRSLAWIVPPNPLTLLPALHPYVYDEITGTVGSEPKLELRRVEHQGQIADYFQDPIDRARFYYLPDSFRLLRWEEVPRTPAMLVQFSPAASDNGGGLDDVMVSLRYAAGPHVRAGRLEAAAVALAQHLPAGGEQVVALEPLPLGDLRFELQLPGDGVVTAPRPDAVVTAEGLSDLLNLPMSRFQQVWDAMFARDALVFAGAVRLGAGASQYAIPFAGRFAETTGGQLLETSFVPEPDGPGVVLSIANMIESPVTIGKLDLALAYGEQTIAGVAAELALPLTVPAGAVAAMLVSPATAPPDGVAPALAATLDDIEVEPDREQVLAAIRQDEVMPELTHSIEVKTFAAYFAPPADPAQQLLGILVQFERGTTVDLTADALAKVAVVRTPIDTVLLGATDLQRHRYKRTIIRLGGRKADTDWQTVEGTVFYPEVDIPDPPPPPPTPPPGG
jgi:hypothetical protein